VRLLAPLALLLLLAACTPLTPPVEGAAAERAWVARQARLVALDPWHLTGRYLLTDQVEVWSGTLDWQQQGLAYALLIKGPLGQGGAQIQGQGGAVRMALSDGRELLSDDVEGLLREQFGWAIPVGALRYWVRGLPAPNDPLEGLRLDAEGRALTFQQRGWSLDFPAYQDAGGLSLPRRLEATRGDYTLKLVIGDWHRDMEGGA